MGQGRGFGKVILFNEHFVVYGISSIVSAIGDYTEAEVIKLAKLNDLEYQIIDHRPETPGYKAKKFEQQNKSIELILQMLNLDLENHTLQVKFTGNLLAASGVGASAASCAAFARALNSEYALGMNDQEINKLAYQGEMAYHGKPSGVDNTAATYGGLIQFTKGDTPKFEHIRIPAPVEIVMGNTGLVTNTEQAVKGVRERREKLPEKYDIIFERAKKLVPQARSALETGAHKTVGKLMAENHKLLQEIGVSCKELDHLVTVAEDHGAFGAKMTGTGLGGYMLALTPGNELQEAVAKAIEDEGFSTLKTTIGV
ncbi:mevalonate kinase [[Eubacterium] cellulosolvens]